MKAQKLEEQYQALVLEALNKYSCISDIENEAEQLTSKLLALQKPLKRKRKKANDKSLFLMMRNVLIEKFGADKANGFLMSLLENEQLHKRSIYIPSSKRIKQLLSQ